MQWHGTCPLFVYLQGGVGRSKQEYGVGLMGITMNYMPPNTKEQGTGTMVCDSWSNQMEVERRPPHDFSQNIFKNAHI